MRTYQEITDILFDSGLVINKKLVDMAFGLEMARRIEIEPPAPRPPQIVKDEYGREKEMRIGDIIYKVYPGNQWATAERKITGNGFLYNGLGGGNKFFSSEDRELWIKNNKPVIARGKLESAISFLDPIDARSVIQNIEQ